MEKGAKNFQPSTNLIQELHQLIQLLTNKDHFRKNLPEALRLLNQGLGASNALLFEVTPTYSDIPYLIFERLLQIPSNDALREHMIPDQLVDIHFPISMLEDWLAKLKAFSGTLISGESVNEKTKSSGVICGTIEVLKKACEDVDILTLTEAIGVAETSFILFPLLREQKAFGFLFFLSSKEKKVWEEGAIDLAYSGANLITNLLEQEHTEDVRQLEMQALSGKREMESLAGNDLSGSKAFKKADHSVNEFFFSSIILNIIPDFAFIVDLAIGEVVYCNAKAFLGYELKEDTNEREAFINNIHPDFKKDIIKGFFEQMKNIDDSEIFIQEYMVRHKEGHWVWINERIKVYKRFPDGRVKQYLSFMQDVTEKKKTFLALEKSEERYRNFVSYSSEGVYYTNCNIPISIHLPIEEQATLFYKNAYIEECNLVMAKMYGFQSEQGMIGCTIEELHQGEFYELNKSSFRKIAKNAYNVEDAETIEFTPGGKKRYFLNRAVGIIEQDHLVGMWGVQRDITDKRLAEIAYKKNQSRYSSIVKDANMGIWDWQLKPGTMQVNGTFASLLGLDKEQLLLDQATILELVHPDDFLALRTATVRHITDRTDNYHATVRFRTGAGEWRWFQVYGRLVEDASDGSPKRVSGMMLDVHQQKTTEILLQEGAALLKAVLDAMPDTKLHVKRDGTIIAVYRSSQQNKEEQAYFPQNIVGKNLEEVMPVFTAKGLLFNVSKAINTKTLQSFEYLNIIEDTTYYFEARVNQVNEDEAIIILRDITSVKKIENNLNEQIYKHDQNVRQLKKYIESNLQLENFAYIASHDLREPLRTMRMFAQFLKKKIGDQLDAENLSYLDFIISGAKRMNGLIEGILSYSRVDTEPLEKEIIITKNLIADSVDNLNKAIEKQEAEVIIEKIPSPIYGSKIRLEQVFQNLIANGIKFSKPGTSPRIVISGYETKSHWVFKVADNGIGIKKEFFDHIFVLFKKLHNNKDFEGAGIGLALLKRIVEQHGGEIWLESDENIGTTFLFSLSKEQTGNG